MNVLFLVWGDLDVMWANGGLDFIGVVESDGVIEV
jgi:hypothetical protein